MNATRSSKEAGMWYRQLWVNDGKWIYMGIHRSTMGVSELWTLHFLGANSPIKFRANQFEVTIASQHEGWGRKWNVTWFKVSLQYNHPTVDMVVVKILGMHLCLSIVQTTHLSGSSCVAWIWRFEPFDHLPAIFSHWTMATAKECLQRLQSDVAWWLPTGLGHGSGPIAVPVLLQKRKNEWLKASLPPTLYSYLPYHLEYDLICTHSI